MTLGGCEFLNNIIGNPIELPDTELTPNIETRKLARFSSSVVAGYDGVEELVEDLDILAYKVAKSTIESGQTYYPYWGWGRVDDIALAEMDASSAAEKKDSSYETNNQVIGVDEADIVKSDGRFIFLAFNGDIVVLDREGGPGEEKIADRLSIFSEKTISDLLLSDSTLLAISGGSGWYAEDSGWTEGTKLALLSVSREGKLSIRERQTLSGSYISARLMDDQAFIFTNTYLDYYTLTQAVSPYHADFEDMNEDSRKRAAYEKLKSLIPLWRNSVLKSLFVHEGVVDSRMIRNTMRLYSLTDSDEASEKLLPFESPFSSYTQITSFDVIAGFASIRRAGSFSTNGGWANLYSDGETIVVANNGWEWKDGGDWHEVTYLLTFSNFAGIVSPLSTGKIEGYTINQFSMDVHNDYLRVATTQSARWGFVETEGRWEEVSQSESFITLMDIDSSPMEVVGKVGGLGKGERITAARFMGDIAYVVTFRQIDPFYTVNLSDPRYPFVAGELKVPGFSNYLHPMEEGFVLAIGQDADDSGFTQGLQIAVYDVTNVSNPTQKYKYVIKGNSYSNAQWDHHAFRYLPSRNLLVLPVSVSENLMGRYYSANTFMLFSVSKDEEIDLLGEVKHPESYAYYPQPRSMVFGDELITMKGENVLANDLGNKLVDLWKLQLK